MYIWWFYQWICNQKKFKNFVTAKISHQKKKLFLWWQPKLGLLMKLSTINNKPKISSMLGLLFLLGCRWTTFIINIIYHGKNFHVKNGKNITHIPHIVFVNNMKSQVKFDVANKAKRNVSSNITLKLNYKLTFHISSFKHKHEY